MSGETITLNNSDFQCLQDQLVDLKAKNYDLAEKNRRSQADFETAKSKICSLQFKLEEQERDFQIISTTLRREIETLTGGSGLAVQNQTINCDSNNAKDSSEAKCKQLSLNIEELELKYQESKEIAQQLDHQNRDFVEKFRKVQLENEKLREEYEGINKQVDLIKKEHKDELKKLIEDIKKSTNEEKQKLKDNLELVQTERDLLRGDVEKLTAEIAKFDQRLEIENEERKIQERKGLQIVKELKRQLAQEKNRTETLQKRIEQLLSAPPPAPTTSMTEEISTTTPATTVTTTTTTTNTDNDLTHLGSTSSSTNGNGITNQDTNSVGSWSFVPVKTTTSNTSNSPAKSVSNTGLNETLSLCSVDSEERETVQRLCDTTTSDSLSNLQQHRITTTNSDSDGTPRPQSLSNSSNNNNCSSSPLKKLNDIAVNFASLKLDLNDHAEVGNSLLNSKQRPASDVYFPLPSSLISPNDGESKGMLIEEQAALVDRLTKLQHDKWQLEEKLSYMEQANSSLTEDLANKSDIIKQYFMNKAIRAIESSTTSTPSSSSSPTSANTSHNHDNCDGNYNLTKTNTNNNHPRRLSFPNNVNQIISEKPSLKKVVDFLKEKSHNPLLLSSVSDSENISKEATKKMQIMLEETLIKCLKLQENLDFVTAELNKLKN